MTRKQRLRETLRTTVEDAVTDLLFYDRKEDEELGHKDLAELFDKGWVTKAEIAAWFEEALDAA